LAIFVAAIVGIITKPLPMGAIALFGIAATALTGTLTINQALSGFGNSTIWLIVVAFFISRGFIKTGLGSRIAYLFMAALGKKTLGLSFALIATDLVLAPAIPSNTARAGGIVFPLVKASAKAYSSVRWKLAPASRFCGAPFCLRVLASFQSENNEVSLPLRVGRIARSQLLCDFQAPCLRQELTLCSWERT
jgi:di/tricarboxylate transporter